MKKKVWRKVFEYILGEYIVGEARMKNRFSNFNSNQPLKPIIGRFNTDYLF